MNVVHLSTSDSGGGAARAAYRLHRGLQGLNIETEMYVRDKCSSNASVRALNPDGHLAGKLRRLWRYGRIQLAFAPYRLSRPNHLELFSDDRSRFREELVVQLPSADVYDLHWIVQFVDLQAFFEHTTAPVVWTLHDMNAFTGGCHYNVGCERYAASCGHCPQLGSAREQDLSRSVWSRKQATYRNAIHEDRLHIAAPSEWLGREARRSELLGEAPVHVIPNGLDHTTFRPRNEQKTRRGLGVPDGHNVVLFVAQSTTKHRKGFSLLAEALGALDMEDTTLLSVGDGEPSLSGNLPHVHAGRIEDDEALSRVYSLADIFVIPSRQDNLPNTVLESMACGTPVVGFNVGGIPDMVRPSETGWLAETGNVRELRQAIETALENDEERERMGRRCREVVGEEYTLERQARQYRALYESVLNQQ